MQDVYEKVSFEDAIERLEGIFDDNENAVEE